MWVQEGLMSQATKRVSISKDANPFISLVGARGFEPPTTCTPCRYATRLRYAPEHFATMRTIDPTKTANYTRSARRNESSYTPPRVLMRRYPWLALFVFAWLGGCATAPQIVSPDVREARRQAREQLASALDVWAIQGRMALYDANEAWNADVRWRQRRAEYDIHVSGPFGQGRMRLRGDAAGVTLETAAQTYRDRDLDTLTQRHLGRDLPVHNLTWWVRGLPAPGPRYVLSLDAQGRLLRLEQDGWDIDFKRYVEIEGVTLPDKIFLKNGAWSLRLSIQDWRLHAVTDS